MRSNEGVLFVLISNQTELVFIIPLMIEVENAYL